MALAWTLLDRSATTPLLGARTLVQFEDNLAALDGVLTSEQRDLLDAASAINLGFAHEFLSRETTRKVVGDLKLEGRG